MKKPCRKKYALIESAYRRYYNKVVEEQGGYYVEGVRENVKVDWYKNKIDYIDLDGDRETLAEVVLKCGCISHKDIRDVILYY